QNEAIAKFEEEKKPILQKRAEAKAAADLCDRELSAVERRLQDTDAVDRALVERISALQAQVPPPDDLDAQMAGLSAKRVKLPDRRAEIVRARLGAAEACRQAKEKLSLQDSALEEIDKRIAQVRSEFETRDRSLNETARSQQE